MNIIFLDVNLSNEFWEILQNACNPKTGLMSYFEFILERLKKICSIDVQIQESQQMSLQKHISVWLKEYYTMIYDELKKDGFNVKAKDDKLVIFYYL